MTSTSLSPAIAASSSPDGPLIRPLRSPSAAIASTRGRANALPGTARRVLKGAFLFFLVKGMLWLAAPLALLLAR